TLPRNIHGYRFILAITTIHHNAVFEARIFTQFPFKRFSKKSYVMLLNILIKKLTWYLDGQNIIFKKHRFYWFKSGFVMLPLNYIFYNIETTTPNCFASIIHYIL